MRAGSEVVIALLALAVLKIAVARRLEIVIDLIDGMIVEVD